MIYKNWYSECEHSLKDVTISLRAARLQKNNIIDMRSDTNNVNLSCVYITHSYKISSDWYDVNMLHKRYQ